MPESTSKHLYLIALVPDQGLREDIKTLKEEMKSRFNAAHALKSPAHLTLQMPFHRSEKQEPQLLQCLDGLGLKQQAFEIQLSGFDCFPPNVLFVRVLNHHPIIELHDKLKKALTESLGFEAKKLTQKVHPHMTIATRDLTEASFNEAWSEFKSRTFEASFPAKSIFLLRHNGKTWDLIREFPFGA